LQRRLPIADILFRSGDIRDRSPKSCEIAPKKQVFLPPIFGGGPQILDLVFKIAPISDHVAIVACGSFAAIGGETAEISWRIKKEIKK